MSFCLAITKMLLKLLLARGAMSAINESRRSTCATAMWDEWLQTNMCDDNATPKAMKAMAALT